MSTWEWLRWVNLSLAVALLLVIGARSTQAAPVPVRVGLVLVGGWVAVDAATSWGTALDPGWRIPARTGLLLLSGWWLWVDYRHAMAETRIRGALAALVDDDPADDPADGGP